MKVLIGNRCVWCGEDTSFGSGKFVNRLSVGTTGDAVTWLPIEYQKQEFDVDGWGCADCAGYECDICGKQIYLDEDITDDNEVGHYHTWCLPIERWHVESLEWLSTMSVQEANYILKEPKRD
jgi:hypothetical protein